MLETNVDSGAPSLVENYKRWLVEQRGLTQATVSVVLCYVRQFIAAVGEDPARYHAEGIRGFILARAGMCGSSAVKGSICAVRGFLRYLVVHGRCSSDLVLAVPTVASRRRSSVPRYLSEEDVERVIAACDPATAIGVRDRAIVLLLARLGLRASDVVRLRLQDIDWTKARLRVRGKSRQEAVLPLAQEVGDSILDYLNRVRAPAEDDHVFLHAFRPMALKGSSAITDLAARAIKRAGVEAPSPGAHTLRHSAATHMLRQGASLETIGVILRHRSVDSTIHYAKVDFEMLRCVAQPWPARELPRC